MNGRSQRMVRNASGILEVLSRLKGIIVHKFQLYNIEYCFNLMINSDCA